MTFRSSTSGVKIAAMAYLGEFHSTRNRAKYFTLLVCAVSAGVVLQPLLAMAIIPLDIQWAVGSVLTIRSWRLYILAGNIIQGLSLLGIFWLPEGPKYTLARGRDEDAIRTLATVYSVNTGLPKEVGGFYFFFILLS